MKGITIGIAAGRKYDNYFNWISQLSDIKVIKLNYHEKNFNSIEHCDGIILSGGEDVHPRFYKQAIFVDTYHLDDIDEARDAFEIKVLDHVQKSDKPLLGICRGLQIANVFYGGTLIPDIPSFGKPPHTKHEEGRDRVHTIRVAQGSTLEQITGSVAGEINSAHHQSVDLPGEGLVVNAVSEDGIIEGMEWKEKEGKAFMLLVQWHPERMNVSSPFSGKIRDRFLENVRGR